MVSKVRAVVSGLGACGALGLFLVGVPIFLVRLVGNPLPAAMPSWSSLVAAIEAGSLPAGALGSVLAVVVWIWWSQAALSFAAEAWAALRGRPARSLPLRGLGTQPIMVRLVAILVAAAATVGTIAQPAAAATPSFAEIAVPLEVAAAAQSSKTEPATPADGQGRSVAAASLPSAPILGLPEVADPSADVGAVAPVLRLPGAADRPADLSADVGAGVSAPVLGLPGVADPLADVGVGVPAPVLGLPGVTDRAADLGVGVPAPVLGLPEASDRAADLPADLGTVAPVLELRGESLPEALSPAPAAPVESATSARWDPVVAQQARAPVAQAPAPVAPAEQIAPAPAEQISPPPAEQSPAATLDERAWIVVKPGDSLWHLAEQHLGDALRWRDLFELNVGQLEGGGTLRDPNLIHPGWRLRLPELDQPPISQVQPR